MHVKAKTHFFKSLDLTEVMVPADDTPGAFTATKLVCSLGPSSHNVEVLEEMLRAGMVAARIDLTWGGLDFHRATLAALNAAMANTKKLCAVVLSSLGREVMVRRQCVIGDDGWPAHPDPFNVTAGQTLMITTRQDVEASPTVLPVTYPLLHNMVKEGDTIYIGRYLVCGSDSASLYLTVLQVEGQDIICEAQNSAVMDGLMTVFHMERSADSLLNLQNNLPLFSEYDRQAIAALGAEFEIDYVNLAYTRTREDVREARLFLDSLGMTHTKILAKVETRQALLNFRGILAAADGIVMSRGNIGLDVAPEKMALVQKQLISHCNLLGKPVLITRVVDSMVSNPRPTRAEATDIANAVLDGVDGILLGAETLRGEYPVHCVETISQICRVAEGVFDYSSHYDSLMAAAQELNAAVTYAAAAEPQLGSTAQLAINGNGRSSSGALSGKNVAFAAGTSPGDTEEGIAEEAEASDSGSYNEIHAMATSGSYGQLSSAYDGYQELAAFTKFGGAGAQSVYSMAHKGSTGSMVYAAAGEQLPYLSKLESLASSAVRTAGNTKADLIVVYTATGRTAQLVAKYRPPMPILTLVVPRLINDGIRWRLEGKATARACQLTRGLLPMLATPGPNGDAVLEAAVVAAARAGLVAPRHHVVVLQQVHDDFCVKVMSLDSSGSRVVMSLDSSGSRVVGSNVKMVMSLDSSGSRVVMSLDSSGSRVVGSNVKMVGRTITGVKTVRMSTRSGSTGALVDSDDDTEEEEEHEFGGAGSFKQSASMLYKANAAAAVTAAAAKLCAHNLDIPARTLMSPVSPETPMRLGSIDQACGKAVTLADA
uniref:Pyruvate kinase n=2 Tax=Tetradesmus obliquus TaxID=3088 RepID=A0A383WJV2_TETOB|eukprot:jgi/Sobl393_1/19573/SZX77026.1